MDLFGDNLLNFIRISRFYFYFYSKLRLSTWFDILLFEIIEDDGDFYSAYLFIRISTFYLPISNFITEANLFYLHINFYYDYNS